MQLPASLRRRSPVLAARWLVRLLGVVGLTAPVTTVSAQVTPLDPGLRVPVPRVLVVGPALGPGIDFTAINPALNAAEQGQVILVLANASYYAPFTATNKGVTILFEDAARTYGTSTVRNLAAGLEFKLVEFESNGLTIRNNTGVVSVLGGRIDELDVANNAGQVWLEDTVITVEPLGTQTNAAASLTNASAVTFRNVVARGAYSALGNPSFGLLADDSTVYAFGSTFIGTGAGIFGGGGRDGARLIAGSFLYADGCEFHGGGGNSFDCGTLNEGGPGLLASDSDAVLRSPALYPGYGHDPCAMGSPPLADPTITVGTGTITTITSSGYGMTVTNPVHTDELLQVHVTGAPDGMAFLLGSHRSAPAYLPVYLSASMLAGPTTVLAAVQLDGAGAADVSLPVKLPRGSLADVLWIQAVFLDTTMVQGPASAVVVLDPRL